MYHGDEKDPRWNEPETHLVSCRNNACHGACFTESCQYSAAHLNKGVPATTTIDCGPVGVVPACAACAAFYERMSNATR